MNFDADEFKGWLVLGGIFAVSIALPLLLVVYGRRLIDLAFYHLVWKYIALSAHLACIMA